MDKLYFSEMLLMEMNTVIARERQMAVHKLFNDVDDAVLALEDRCMDAARDGATHVVAFEMDYQKYPKHSYPTYRFNEWAAEHACIVSMYGTVGGYQVFIYW